MDKKQTSRDDSQWQVFLKAKIGMKQKQISDGELRNLNMSNFISKSNVFQNESMLDQDKQKATLSQLDIKLGKDPGADESTHNKVQFRSEPLRPKQTAQEKDMFLIAKPLIQEYTTLNIVKQPSIHAYAHKISADIHRSLENQIKNSENLTSLKRNQTVVPRKGQTHYKKVINEEFLDLIRRTDQGFSPLKSNNIPNPYSPEQNNQSKTNIEKNLIIEMNKKRNKYDKEYDFRQFAKGRELKNANDQLGEVRLPQSIQEIMSMRSDPKSKNEPQTQFQFQVMPDEEFIFMEDLLEQSNFNTNFNDQAVEGSRQQMKLQNKEEQINNFNKASYYYSSKSQIKNADIDVNHLDFNSIIQITSGQLPVTTKKSNSYEQRATLNNLQKQQSSIVSNQSIEGMLIAKPSVASISQDNFKSKNKQIQEEEYEDDDDVYSDDEIYFQNKCVGTTPKNEKLIQKDESVQISSLQIEEDTRNIPRIGAILSQIKTIKKQHNMAAERQDRAKLATLLNHRLVDLMNLLMLEEKSKVDNIGDAVQYLLSLNKKYLQDKMIDGISKLELLYLFLTEYKVYKLMTENELDQSYAIANQEGNLILVQKTTKKKTQNKEAYKTQNNKKVLNSHSYHFSVPLKQQDDSQQPRYMQTTHSTIQKYNSSTSKKSENKSPISINPREGNWIMKPYSQIDDVNQKFGWTKVN